MIPFKKIKIGCYSYDIVVAKARQISVHGETNLDTKQILVIDSGNEQILKETLQHEILHALSEDIFGTIKYIDDDEKLEEAFIRLFSPRLMVFCLDNPKAVRWLWNLN